MSVHASYHAQNSRAIFSGKSCYGRSFPTADPFGHAWLQVRLIKQMQRIHSDAHWFAA